MRGSYSFFYLSGKLQAYGFNLDRKKFKNHKYLYIITDREGEVILNATSLREVKAFLQGFEYEMELSTAICNEMVKDTDFEEEPREYYDPWNIELAESWSRINENPWDYPEEGY